MNNVDYGQIIKDRATIVKLHQALMIGLCPDCYEKLERGGGKLRRVVTERPFRLFSCGNCGAEFQTLELMCRDPMFLEDALPHICTLIDQSRI